MAGESYPQGLLDTNRGGTLKELQEQLHVYLCDENGKQLVQLPITSTITNLDSGGANAGYNNRVRGSKLILCIGEGRSQPMWRDYASPSTVGLIEDIVMVTLPPTALPEDIRGYEAVDGIVWLNAQVPSPAVPTEEKRHRALQEYVRSGGRLVICQPPQREQTAAFGEELHEWRREDDVDIGDEDKLSASPADADILGDHLVQGNDVGMREALVKLARTKAVLAGRDFVTPEDVKAVALPALAHRIALRPDSWVAGIKGEGIVQEVLDSVPAPPPEPEGGR